MARNDYDPATVPPDGRPATRARLFDPGSEGPWRGSVAGLDLGGRVTVLAYGTDEIGVGPRLHVHPYDETFVVIAGRGRFFVGDTVFDVSAGEIVLGPAGVPHRFENAGRAGCRRSTSTIRRRGFRRIWTRGTVATFRGSQSPQDGGASVIG